MGDLQVGSKQKDDKYSSPTSMRGMLVEKGDNLEAVISVDVEEVDTFYNVAWKRFSKQLNVPGYRPGKAPREMLNQKHGHKVQELVTTALMDDFYKRSVKRLPGKVTGSPKFFYEKPATFGESFKFSFVIPKPEGFGQEGYTEEIESAVDELFDDSADKPALTSEDEPDHLRFDLDKYINVIEPPDISKVELKRVVIGINDQEVEERVEEYRRSHKMNDDEIAQHLKLSSVAELPSYFRNELGEERRTLGEWLLSKQVAPMVLVGSKLITSGGGRTELTGAAGLISDREERKKFMSVATVAVFFKIAEFEGMKEEIAAARSGTTSIDDFILLVSERVIKKAIIKEIHFESWAKAEEFIRRSADQ